LFADCFEDERAAGRLDAAILVLALGVGLRRAECAAIALADCNSEDHVKIRGKSDKQRLMPLPESANQAVLDWLTVRGVWDGPLLCRVRKMAPSGSNPSPPKAIYKALAKRGQGANLAHFSPHDLRKTYASG